MGIIHTHCNHNEPTPILLGLLYSLKQWINMRNAHLEMKSKSKDFSFILESGKPFRYDHLND